MSEARSAIPTLDAYVAAEPVAKVPAAAPAPGLDKGQAIRSLPTISIADSLTPALPWGGKGALVLVNLTLSAPAPMMMSWQLATFNAAGAYAPVYYDQGVVDADGKAMPVVIFRQGEQRKVAYVRVKVLPDAKTTIGVAAVKGGNSVMVNGAMAQSNNAQGFIRVGDTATIAQATDPAPPALPSPPSRAPDYATDFVKLPTSPTGSRATWATMGSARWINNELGPYVDPTLHPGTDPFPLIDGVRVLRARKHATADIKEGALFQWEAPMLTTGGPGVRTDANSLFLMTYGWVEIDSDMPYVQGFVPAVWFMNAGGEWPPEYDAPELFWSGGEVNAFAFTTFLAPAGNRFGHSFPVNAAPGMKVTGRHTLLIHIAPLLTQVWLDGVLIDERPTVMHAPKYILLSMSVGMGGGAVDPKASDVRWPIYGMRAWCD